MVGASLAEGVFLAAGAVMFALADTLPDPDPVAHSAATLHLSEICVIVSLMGAGCALPRGGGRASGETPL